MLKEIAVQTFSGQGLIIIQMALIALAGFLFRYIAIAAQQPQIANMIGAATVFTCISMVAATAFHALNAVLNAVGF